MSFHRKIISWDQLPTWREEIRAQGRRLVATNGCFDILHLGHVTYLDSASQLGDILLVGVNGDASVRQLKGADRPVNSESDRAALLASLESVGAVCIFEDVNALRFLAAARPDIYVKGGDYTLETLNQDERNTVEGTGAQIRILPVVPGKSTSALLKQISRL